LDSLVAVMCKTLVQEISVSPVEMGLCSVEPVLGTPFASGVRAATPRDIGWI